MDLLPVLIQIYGSSVNAPVHHTCFSAIGKLFYFSNADMIQSLLGATNISSFLAGVLAWKDPQVLLPSLEIADILMEKLPETFTKLFVRECVVHAVDKLIIPESSKKDTDSTPGTSTHSKCYRHRVDTSNSDATSADDPKKCTILVVSRSW